LLNRCFALSCNLPLLQSPALRTEYYRTAWQRYDSNSVRLSLDEHMLLLREGGQPGQWCAGLEGQGQLPGSDAVRFPYGILEIKLQEEAPGVFLLWMLFRLCCVLVSMRCF
jgi:SPX domain protein involved in polyphosphate accumulation